jgi:uncharacterized protein YcfL
MKSLVFLLALVLFAGCATHQASQPAPVPTVEKKPDRRVILDPALRAILKVVAVNSETGGDNILKFQVDVQNLTLVYQIDWFDKAGTSLGIKYNDLHWLLLPHETGPLTMTAPSPLVKDFRLSFRPRPRNPSPTPP